MFLTVAPWWPQGMWGFSDWGNNYFLLYAARKTGYQALQTAVASGWVRGAVTGVGLLNLGIAFWEIFNFNQTVRALQAQLSSASSKDVRSPEPPNNVPHNERQDDTANNS